MELDSSIPDPVHKYVGLTKLEKTLINLPQFQRLKRIKQLGVASVVFPGALHTRFEHSLGTMHIANLIFERFKNEFDETHRRKVRLAGLLHDIGHSAFSHTVELGLRRMEKIVQPRYKNHEAYTRNVIANLGNKSIVKEALKEAGITEKSNSFFTNIGYIATGKKESLNEKDKFLSSIISGEIDADRIDYLIRDGLHTGINFIGFNLEHILENVSRDMDKLVIGKKGENRSFDEIVSINLGESFLISRYHYYSNILNHPKNVAANIMLIKALEYTLKKLLDTSSKNKVEQELDNFFWKYDDNDLLNFIKNKGTNEAKKLIDALLGGRIFYCACDLKAHAITPNIKLYIELLNQNPSIINNVEREINKIIQKQRIYIGITALRGIPKSLRVKICNTHRFLYDESKLAASLIMEILSSGSLYFFCQKDENIKSCNELIKKNWCDITNIMEEKIAEERIKKPYQLELSLLFFHEYLREHGDFQVPMIYITKIYEMMEWIKKNYQNSFTYKFNKDFNFLYSPELFEDIMKLGSIGLLKILIEEKSRSIYDYGIKEGHSLLDYFNQRNHTYYQFEITPEGKMYCDYIKKYYLNYLGFLSKNISFLHHKFYIEPLYPKNFDKKEFYYSP